MNGRLAAAMMTGGVLATALTAAPAEAVVQAAATTKTYVGTSIATPFGPVQVSIQVRRKKVLAITATSFPNRAPLSSSINATAIPRLTQQALAAQSAQIDGVSGASWSTYGFTKSLQAALVKAGLA